MAKEHEVKRLCGVDLAEVDESAVDAALKQFALPAGGAIGMKIKRLATHFDQFPDKDLAVCDCGGESLMTYEVCPYCGAAGEEGPDSGEVEPAEPGKAAKPDQAAKPEKAATKPEKAATKPAAKPAAKPDPEIKVVEPKAEKVQPSDVQVLAAIPPKTLEESEKTLNESVRRINELKLDYMRSTWELGHAISDNYEGQLWKLRVVDGKPAYHNVKQFWAEELGFSPPWAYMMMDVSKVFTKDEVAEVGPTKLGLVLKAPLEHRRKLLAEAKKGASKRQLQDRLKEIKVKGDMVAQGKADKPERVTVAFTPGRLTLKMWARTPGAKKADPKRAKKVGDNPWCDEVLSNDVKVLYRLVQEPSGELALVVERRRLDKKSEPE